MCVDLRVIGVNINSEKHDGCLKACCRHIMNYLGRFDRYTSTMLIGDSINVHPYVAAAYMFKGLDPTESSADIVGVAVRWVNLQNPHFIHIPKLRMGVERCRSCGVELVIGTLCMYVLCVYCESS